MLGGIRALTHAEDRMDPLPLVEGPNRPDQFTTLLAQQLLANASGLALKAKPIPRI